MALISIRSTEALSFHPETGAIHAEGKIYPDIHLAVIAIQGLFGESAKKSLELASQLKKALPSPDLSFLASRKGIETEVGLAEGQLGDLEFLSETGVKQYRPLLRGIRKVNKNKKTTTEFDNLLLRPYLISAWLVETKKIVEKKPDIDLLSQILIEREFEMNYLEHTSAIFKYLENNLTTYSEINDLRSIKNLMFNIRNLLLNPYKLLTAPYKQTAQQTSNLINQTNILEPQKFYRNEFKDNLKKIIGKCLMNIKNGLEIKIFEPELS